MAKKEGEKPVQSAYRQRLTEMLDLTYELEGLLHIGVTRSMVPPRLNRLIVNKLNAIVALADEPPADGSNLSSEISTDDIAESSEYAEASDEASDSIETRLPEASFYADEAVEDIDTKKEIVASVEIPVSDAPDETVSETVTVDESFLNTDFPQDPDLIAKQTESDKSGKPSGGRIFSINDRFLFARELFGGKVSDFDKAINTVITFDSPEEAEEYFITEWNFDTENPVAVEFLDKIRLIF